MIYGVEGGKYGVNYVILSCLVIEVQRKFGGASLTFVSVSGPGESGKSTIFKQMKIIQMNGGFTEEEKKAYRYIVFGNCITQMKVIVTAADKLGVSYSSPQNKERADRIAKVISNVFIFFRLLLR